MSRTADKLLTVIFAGMITVPWLLYPFVRTPAEDTGENRQLTEFSTVTEASLPDLPDAFAAYYNDHVPFRSALKKLWSNANYLLLGEAVDERVLVGKPDPDRAHVWLFYQAEEDGNPLKEAQGISTYDETAREEMYAVLAENEKTLQDYGMELYYFAGPNKESVYPEYLPGYLKQYRPQSRLADFIGWLQAEHGYDRYIYPLAELRRASENGQTYYRQDIHWNAYGAYIGYKALMAVTHPELDPAFMDDMELSYGPDQHLDTDLIRISGIRDLLLDQPAVVSFHDDFTVEYNRMFNDTVLETRCEQAPVDRTVFLIGDSFRTDLIPYLERTYKHCFIMHRWDYRTIFIDWFWPDEVVMLSVERYAPDNLSIRLKQEEETYPLEQ